MIFCFIVKWLGGWEVATHADVMLETKSWKNLVLLLCFAKVQTTSWKMENIIILDTMKLIFLKYFKIIPILSFYHICQFTQLVCYGVLIRVIILFYFNLNNGSF